jgi:hypothetical protein
VVTCQFCGLAHDTTTAFRAFHATTVTVGAPQRVRRTNRLVWAIVLIVVAMITVSVLVPAIFGVWVAKSALDRVAPGAVARLSEAKRPLAPGELASLTKGGGWKVLATDPPVGGFADFDPVASLPWAQAIGRAWASDAVVTRVDVGRLAATGAVDLSGEQSSGYRFASPGRHQQWTTETDAGGRPVTATGLMLQITGTEVRALPYEERFEPGAPAPVSLPLAEILERARRNPAFADKPYYSGYLIHLPREGWVWYFRAISGTSGYPRVRARDGRTYPYR